MSVHNDGGAVGVGISAYGASIGKLAVNATAHTRDTRGHTVADGDKSKKATCIISYDPNGGDGGPAAQTIARGESLRISSEQPMRTGYAFIGWSINQWATIATYKPGTSYLMNADVVLFAVWGYPIVKVCPENGSFTVPAAGEVDSKITISSIHAKDGYAVGAVSVKRNDNGDSIPVSAIRS